jgi:hypothetical protein
MIEMAFRLRWIGGKLGSLGLRGFLVFGVAELPPGFEFLLASHLAGRVMAGGTLG